MSTTAEQIPAPRAGTRRTRITIAAVVVGCVLAAAMAWVWWSFFALRDDQSYRVLFSTGSFVSRPGPGTAAAGTVLHTGEDGFATVELSDGTVIKLMPNTALDIEDARASARGGRFATGVRLRSGEVETRVERGDGRRRELSLFSPSVAIGVRGTVFSVRDEGERAWVTVTRGAVEAAGASGDPVSVGGGQGTVVARGEPAGEVTALPPPPAPETATAHSERGLEFAWAGDASPEYLLEIAEDESFDRLLRRHRVGWQRGTVEPLERDGRYYWRVAAIDARGLRGRFSAGTALEHDYHIARARAALERLDPGATQDALARSRAGLEPELDRLRARGLRALEAGDYAGARSLLETVLAMRPHDAAASNALAVSEYHLLDYAAARARFSGSAERATAGGPGDADARVGIALIDVRQGEFARGLRAAEQVLEGEPRHLGALQVAAMASVGLGDAAAALAFVERALAAHPADATAQALLRSLEAPGVPPPGRGGGS